VKSDTKGKDELKEKKEDGLTKAKQDAKSDDKKKNKDKAREQKKKPKEKQEVKLEDLATTDGALANVFESSGAESLPTEA